MADVKNSVWYGELERFGYTLSVVSKTEKGVRKALMQAYEKTYRNINDDADPRKDIDRYGETYYKSAADDVVVWEMPFGRVEWR